jgi:Mg-chelatase subunit ChlD
MVFVIDHSGSMSGSDVSPLLPNIRERHNNRLGAVYEACSNFIDRRRSESPSDVVSVVAFDSGAEVVFEGLPVGEATLLERMMAITAGGGTSFTAALRTTESLLQRCRTSSMNCVVLFLSDGEDSAPTGVTAAIVAAETPFWQPKFYSIRFGPDRSSCESLAIIAHEGGGEFVMALDKVSLEVFFERIADEITETIAVLGPRK